MGNSAKNLIFGMNSVPVASGYWGLLLKRCGEAPDLPPGAEGAIQEINDDYIVFSPGLNASNRGFGFVLGGLAALAFLSAFFAVIYRIDFSVDGQELLIIIGFLAVLLVLGAAFCAWAVICLKSRFAPPVILVRSLRKFYFWMNSKDGWLIMNYDEVHPVNMIARMYSAAGGSTGYVLAIVDVVPGTRDIRWYVPLALPRRNIDVPERIWEFIRVYMDRQAESVPEVDSLPPLGDPRADLARMDRFLFGGLVDGSHRVVKGIFPKIYVALSGIVMYWFERAGLWISRAAPRPEWPPELSSIMGRPAASGNYRVRAMTKDQELACEGRLRHLRVRWFILACGSTLLLGATFAFLVLPLWVPGWL